MDAEKFSEYFDNAPVFYGESSFSLVLCFESYVFRHSAWS